MLNGLPSSYLREVLHRRMCEVFGPPESAFGHDDHWSLKPGPVYAPSINLLIDATGEKPYLWIFDPHSRTDGVMREMISSEAEIELLVKHIQMRLERASASATAMLREDSV